MDDELRWFIPYIADANLYAMTTILRTTADTPDFVALVRQLDAELADRDGAEHGFYAQFNTLDAIQHAVVLYEDNQAVSCGALKAFSPVAMEVKRSTPCHNAGVGDLHEVF